MVAEYYHKSIPGLNPTFRSLSFLGAKELEVREGEVIQLLPLLIIPGLPQRSVTNLLSKLGQTLGPTIRDNSVVFLFS